MLLLPSLLLFSLLGCANAAQYFTCQKKHPSPATVQDCVTTCSILMLEKSDCKGQVYIPSTNGIKRSWSGLTLKIFHTKKGSKGKTYPALNILSTCQEICTQCLPPMSFSYDTELAAFFSFDPHTGERRSEPGNSTEISEPPAPPARRGPVRRAPGFCGIGKPESIVLTPDLGPCGLAQIAVRAVPALVWAGGVWTEQLTRNLVSDMVSLRAYSTPVTQVILRNLPNGVTGMYIVAAKTTQGLDWGTVTGILGGVEFIPHAIKVAIDHFESRGATTGIFELVDASDLADSAVATLQILRHQFKA